MSALAERRVAVIIPPQSEEERASMTDLFQRVVEEAKGFGIEGVYYPQTEEQPDQEEEGGDFTVYDQLEEQLTGASLVIVDLSLTAAVPIGICERLEIPVVGFCSRQSYEQLREQPLGRALLGSRAIMTIITYNGDKEKAVAEFKQTIESNKSFLGLP